MDVVVTVSKPVWLSWLAEGDLPGEAAAEEWALYYGSGASRRKPSPPTSLAPGDRVYVVAWGLLRGYAPLVRIESTSHGYALVRGGGAVACTLQDPDKIAGHALSIAGFQGIHYRWWERENEIDFPDWQTRGLPRKLAADVERLTRLRQDAAHCEQLRQRALGGVQGYRLFEGMP